MRGYGFPRYETFKGLKFRPLDNKQFSVLESLCEDKLMVSRGLVVGFTSNYCG